MKDALKQFVDLKLRLTTEREKLMRRLAEINEALADNGLDGRQAQESLPAPARAPRTSATKKQRSTAKNEMSLREAVVKATTGRPLGKQEIVAEVQKLGYTFRGSDPMNVLGTVIYGKKPRFKNENGRFSPLQ
jgi:hypothetical protein